MKKMLLSFGMVVLAASVSFAQEKKTMEAMPAATKGAPAATQNAETMVFKTDVHDFGTVPEGPAAEFEFTFKNTGKEPIVLQKVQPSCGCTTPTYSKDPVLPGKTGTIKASFNTQGRPNAFTKTITVLSNVGTKVLTIKGNVEKAPEGSAPENNSMIKTH